MVLAVPMPGVGPAPLYLPDFAADWMASNLVGSYTVALPGTGPVPARPVPNYSTPRRPRSHGWLRGRPHGKTHQELAKETWWRR